MNKRKISGLILIFAGYILSYALYSILFKEQHVYGFFHSDSFYIIGLPIMFFGAVLFLPFIKKEDLRIGLFAKILLSIVVLVWLALAVGMIAGKLFIK
jgi:hypothetical protein